MVEKVNGERELVKFLQVSTLGRFFPFSISFIGQKDAFAKVGSDRISLFKEKKKRKKNEGGFKTEEARTV